MDHQMKLIIFGISVCILLIFMKFYVFDPMNPNDTLIPGVTDDNAIIHVNDSNPLREYILSDAFTDSVSGFHVESKSEIYVTNDTGGQALFNRCYDSIIANFMEEEKITENEEHGEYTGVFKNESMKLVLHIFEGERVENNVGYRVVMTVYRMKT